MQHTFLINAGKKIETRERTDSTDTGRIINIANTENIYDPSYKVEPFDGLLVRILTDTGRITILPIILGDAQTKVLAGKPCIGEYSDDGAMRSWGDPYRDSWQQVLDIFAGHHRIATLQNFTSKLPERVLDYKENRDVLQDSITVPFGHELKLKSLDEARNLVIPILSLLMERSCNLHFQIKNDPEEMEIPPLGIGINILKDPYDIRSNPKLLISNSFIGEGRDNSAYSHNLAERVYSHLVDRLLANDKFLSTLKPNTLEGVRYRLYSGGAFGKMEITLPDNSYRPDIFFNTVVRELSTISRLTLEGAKLVSPEPNITSMSREGTLVDQSQTLTSPPRE